MVQALISQQAFNLSCSPYSTKRLVAIVTEDDGRFVHDTIHIYDLKPQ